MPVEITSGLFTAKIKAQGAELCSVKSSDGLEYLWQAKEAWPRHAPVLFPIVGKLKDNRFIWQGDFYELGQHGFARDMTFELVVHDDSHCIFELKADSSTKKVFPFDFVLRIAYTFEGNELHCGYEVMNKSQEPLLFSIGAHPGFRCPLLPGEQFSDYYIQLDGNEFEQTVLKEGLRSSDREKLVLENERLALTPTLFDNDALVFEGGQVWYARLASDKNPHSVTCECAGWPFFGIWSKKGNQEFVCLEPWFGIADPVKSTQKLEAKEGIVRLEPGRTFACSYTLGFT